MNSHIGIGRMAEYIENRLASAEKTVVETHLESDCTQCDESLKWLNRIIEVSSWDPGFYRDAKPPDATVRRAHGLFPKKKDAKPDQRKKSLRERLNAFVAFDSRLTAAPIGARSSGAGHRQMLYRADAVDIDLQFQPLGAGGMGIIGQVMPGSDNLHMMSGIQIRVMDGDEVKAEQITNEFGEFMVARLETGRYTISIRLPNHDIVIESVEV